MQLLRQQIYCNCHSISKHLNIEIKCHTHGKQFLMKKYATYEWNGKQLLALKCIVSNSYPCLLFYIFSTSSMKITKFQSFLLFCCCWVRLISLSCLKLCFCSLCVLYTADFSLGGQTFTRLMFYRWLFDGFITITIISVMH